MAAPSVTVTPSTHDSTEGITLTGGPFGQDQGDGFVYAVNDRGEVIQMVVSSWTTNSIVVTYPSEYAPLRTFSEKWGVVVTGNPDTGLTTSTYQGVAPLGAELAAGDPVYVAATGVRVEHQSQSRGYILAAEANGFLQVTLVKPDKTFENRSVESSKLTPMGKLSEAYLIKQEKLPPYNPPELLISQITLTSTNNPSDEGELVTFDVDVMWNAGDLEVVEYPAIPTGTVTFTMNGDFMFTAVLAPHQSNVLISVAQYTTTALPDGTHTITATYNGDSLYVGSSDSLVQTVNAVVANQSTTTAVTTTPNPSGNPGAPVDITATVTPQTSGTPSGNVNFTIGGVAYDQNPVALVGGVATISGYELLPQGTTAIVATYLGGTGYTGSTSASYNHVVNAAPNQNTTTVVSTSPNPSEANDSYNILATVTPAVNGTPTGSVMFNVNGSGFTFGPYSLSGGVATWTLGANTSGTEPGSVLNITAQYSGGTGYNGSTDASAHTHNVKELAGVQISGSPTGEATPGYNVTFTASFTTNGTPTGTVEFFDVGNVTSLGTAPIINGIASISTSALGMGSYTIEARYSGNSTYSAENASMPYEIGAVETFSNITYNSVDNGNGYDVSVTLTVISNSGTPTGNCELVVDGQPALGGTLSGGSYTWVVDLFAGQHTFRADFLGSANFDPSFDEDANLPIP